MEFKSIVAQHENQAAKGIFVVRVPLWCFFSYRWKIIIPRFFHTSIIGQILKILI